MNNYNGYTPNQNPQSYSFNNTSHMSLADYSRKVYAWMTSGLAVTFLVGGLILYFLNTSGLTTEVAMGYMGVYMVVAIIEVVLIFVLGFAIYKLSPTVSLVLFYAYAVCNGVTIAPALYVYDLQSVFFVFLATAGIFAAISTYGMLTKRDLTKLGPILLIGLIGLMIFSIIAMIFRMPMSDLIICLAGIALFVGFTAYDTQKVKKGYEYFGQNPEMLQRSSITIALQLYLDFINLFLYILRLFAKRN